MKQSDDTQINKPAKDTKEAVAPAAKKTGFIRFRRADRPLLRRHITHLINHG